MAAAEAEGSTYDNILISVTFARSLKTGFQNVQVRQHVRPFLCGEPFVSDDVLLKELNGA